MIVFHFRCEHIAISQKDSLIFTDPLSKANRAKASCAKQHPLSSRHPSRYRQPSHQPGHLTARRHFFFFLTRGIGSEVLSQKESCREICLTPGEQSSLFDKNSTTLQDQEVRKQKTSCRENVFSDPDNKAFTSENAKCKRGDMRVRTLSNAATRTLPGDDVRRPICGLTQSS